MHLKEIPFLRILVPWCSGIALSHIADISINAIILLLGFFSILLFISCFTINSYQSKVFGITVAVVMFLSGVLLATHERRSLSALPQKEQLFCSVVLDFPEEKQNSFVIKSKLKFVGTDGTEKRIKGSIVLYHSKADFVYTFMPGDIIMFRTTPLEIRNKGNPYEFDYRFYMESKGFRYYGFIKKGDILFAVNHQSEH